MTTAPPPHLALPAPPARPTLYVARDARRPDRHGSRPLRPRAAVAARRRRRTRRGHARATPRRGAPVRPRRTAHAATRAPRPSCRCRRSAAAAARSPPPPKPPTRRAARRTAPPPRRGRTPPPCRSPHPSAATAHASDATAHTRRRPTTPGDRRPARCRARRRRRRRSPPHERRPRPRDERNDAGAAEARREASRRRRHSGTEERRRRQAVGGGRSTSGAPPRHTCSGTSSKSEKTRSGSPSVRSRISAPSGWQHVLMQHARPDHGTRATAATNPICTMAVMRAMDGGAARALPGAHAATHAVAFLCVSRLDLVQSGEGALQ